MRARLLALVAVLALLLAGGALAAWFFAPRLVLSTPAPGAVQVPENAALQLEFSHVMALDSLQAHLKITPTVSGAFSSEGKHMVFTPDEPWPRGEIIKVELQSGARAIQFPGLPLLQAVSWQFQISRTRLAYLWPSDGPASLYALDPASGDIQRISAGENIFDYSFSPDGRWVYFSADDGQGGSQISRIDFTQIPSQLDSPYAIQPLIFCPQASCRLVVPSPDGLWLAYERAALQAVGSPENSAIWLFSLAAHRSEQLSTPGHVASYPAWSKDGLLAFYDQEMQAYQVVHPTQGDRISLPNQTGGTGIWHPEGSAFIALEVLIENPGLLDPHAASHLIRYTFDESRAALEFQVDLSHDYDLEDNHPAFSPDGAMIAFSRRYLDLNRWTPGRQLWVMQADDPQPQQLTSEPAFHHYGFTWRPDGAQIAYIRFDPTQLTQPPELWLIDANGSNPIQLVIGGFSPAWIP
jgi:Tol biopolymer transport system component